MPFNDHNDDFDSGTVSSATFDRISTPINRIAGANAKHQMLGFFMEASLIVGVAADVTNFTLKIVDSADTDLATYSMTVAASTFANTTLRVDVLGVIPCTLTGTKTSWLWVVLNDVNSSGDVVKSVTKYITAAAFTWPTDGYLYTKCAITGTTMSMTVIDFLPLAEALIYAGP